MSLFKQAIKLVKELKPKSIKVFAPTGLWGNYPDKDEWLEFLGKSGAKVRFIYGEPVHIHPDEFKQVIVEQRLEILKKGKVKTKKIPPQSKQWLGFILLDNIACMGNDDKTKLAIIDTEGSVNLLREGFDKLWQTK